MRILAGLSYIGLVPLDLAAAWKYGLAQTLAGNIEVAVVIATVCTLGAGIAAYLAAYHLRPQSRT